MSRYARARRPRWMIYLLGLDLFFMTSSGTPALGQGARDASKPDLADVLKKTAEYSQKLEHVIYDFACLEKIDEAIDPLFEELQPYEIIPNWTHDLPRAGQRSLRSSYLYDYQCIREGGKIREKRVLLEENGRKTNVPDAELQTASFVYGNALLAPVSLFAERFQSSYDYSIVGTEKVGDVLCRIVEVRPKPGVAEARCSYGRAWIDPATDDILRIEWRDTHVGNWDLLEKRGKKAFRTPRLTLRSDMSIEKNGVRFPTTFKIEEAYVSEKSRAFIRSTVSVVYKDFKFFNVEVEVI